MILLVKFLCTDWFKNPVSPNKMADPIHRTAQAQLQATSP